LNLSSAEGTGGNLTMSSLNAVVSGRVQTGNISTFSGAGNAGNVDIQAQRNTSTGYIKSYGGNTGTAGSAGGSGGTILVDAKQGDLTITGIVNSSGGGGSGGSTGGAGGNAGSITLKGLGLVDITGPVLAAGGGGGDDTDDAPGGGFGGGSFGVAGAPLNDDPSTRVGLAGLGTSGGAAGASAAVLITGQSVAVTENVDNSLGYSDSFYKTSSIVGSQFSFPQPAPQRPTIPASPGRSACWDTQEVIRSH
jgi:hypothetical protein